MIPMEDYLYKCRKILDKIVLQKEAIQQAAKWFSESILSERVVHLFGSGHSRIAVEEMWPRYGSFPGFNPMVELSLTFHNPVVGPNGQRQAMYLENVSGLAERILRNFDLSNRDSALVVSSSGCNTVPIEMAEGFKKRGIRVVAVVSKAHSEISKSRHPEGYKLQNFSDLVLDTGAPPGDAMVNIPNLKTPVCPGSTIGSCILINTIKAEVALLLTRAGLSLKVLTSPVLVGEEKSAALFESAYDEHARLLAKLYEKLGKVDT